MELAGKEIFLKLLTPEDVTCVYVDWMNDSEVTRYLESRWDTFTLGGLKEYAAKINSDGKNYLFGIFLIKTGEHVGNIKIGNINKKHMRADIGLIIGNKKVWGRGYATEAIKLATKFGFCELGLHKLYAGMYSVNVGSFKAFIKAGYHEAGRLISHCFYNGSYIDSFIVEKIRDV